MTKRIFISIIFLGCVSYLAVYKVASADVALAFTSIFMAFCVFLNEISKNK